jgi:hypothetical protein
MSTPDRVMLLLAESQPCKMHFKDQHAPIVLGKATLWKSKCLPSVDGLPNCAKHRESHLSGADSRLLTDESHGRISRSRLEDRQPAKCSVGDSSADTSPDALEIDSIIQMTVEPAISAPRNLPARWPRRCNRNHRRRGRSAASDPSWTRCERCESRMDLRRRTMVSLSTTFARSARMTSR